MFKFVLKDGGYQRCIGRNVVDERENNSRRRQEEEALLYQLILQCHSMNCIISIAHGKHNAFLRAVTSCTQEL